MAVALFIVGLLALVLAWHVHHPVRRPGELAVAMFMLAWLGGELPLHAAALFGGAGIALAALGALGEPLGWVGLALLVLSALGPIASWRQATATRELLSRALGAPVSGDVGLIRYLLPIVHGGDGVARTSEVVHERARADVYRPRGTPAGPVLVYVHGGAWVLGFRRWQGRLLIRRLVRAGWVAVSVQYRLSPWATWPDHIVDVKRALAWVRRMAPGWGADPGRIAISGNSAGGHLATLAALTPGPDRMAAWQPGFEADDTAVQAVVSWYGLYDLVGAVDGSGAWPHRAVHRLWRLLVMKKAFRGAEHAYREASPVAHLGDHAPPILMIHGELDTLVPVSTARAFAKLTAEALPSRVTYLEIPGAEHAFDVFTSRRGVYAVEAAALWLERILKR